MMSSISNIHTSIQVALSYAMAKVYIEIDRYIYVEICVQIYYTRKTMCV